MRDFEGQTAVITGGASGIGRALALEMGRLGARIALCDVHRSARLRTVADLEALGVDVLADDVDVADRSAMIRFAERVIERFGAPHLLFNNAGVGGEWGKLHEQPQAHWSWCLDINVLGVTNAIEAFVGRMVAAGHAGHVVNTASIAGLLCGPGMGAYSPSKAAVVAMSEGLARELEDTRISVSVLCPGFVDTDFLESGRGLANAPPAPTDEAFRTRRAQVGQAMRAAMKPQEVARRTLAAMRRKDLYILTHPEFRDAFRKRAETILSAFDRVADDEPRLGEVLGPAEPTWLDGLFDQASRFERLFHS